MEDERPAAPAGFMASIAGIGDNLISTLQERIELISLELQEEKFRAIRLLIWMGAAVFAGVMALSFVTLTIVYLFWDTARLGVLAAFAIFYSAALAWVVAKVRGTLAQPKPFQATLDSLSEDRACLRRQT